MRLIKDSVLKKVLGPSQEFSLASQIFNAVTFSATVAASFIFVTDIIIGLEPRFYIFSFSAALVFGIIYSIARKGKNQQLLLWLFVFCVLLIIVYDWYFLGGLTGASMIFSLAFVVTLPMMMSGLQKYVASLLMACVGSGMFLTELFNPGLVWEYNERTQHLTDIYFTTLIMGIGIALLVSMVVRNYHAQQEKIKALNVNLAEINNRLEKRNIDLEQALEEVKVLKGIVPICSSCKKVRDDKGYWNQIENYIKTHTGANLSHGICPDCAAKLYHDIKK